MITMDSVSVFLKICKDFSSKVMQWDVSPKRRFAEANCFHPHTMFLLQSHLWGNYTLEGGCRIGPLEGTVSLLSNGHSKTGTLEGTASVLWKKDCDLCPFEAPSPYF
jgi:hypothetical protein